MQQTVLQNPHSRTGENHVENFVQSVRSMSPCLIENTHRNHLTQWKICTMFMELSNKLLKHTKKGPLME